MAYPYQNPYQSYFQQYPQMYPQQMQTPATQLVQSSQIAQNGGMIWVSGQQEAESYLMAPNSAVTLWDSNGKSVYIKQTDASGKPTFKVYDLIEREKTPSAAFLSAPNNSVTREEFDDLAARVEELAARKVRSIKKEENE